MMPPVSMRDRAMAALRAAGVGRGLVMARRAAKTVVDGEHRTVEIKLLREYLDWRRQYRAALAPPLYPPGSSRRALIVTKGSQRGTQVEIALLKGLELGGFVPTVLSNRSDLKKYYRLAGVRDFLRWDAFRGVVPTSRAEALVAAASALEDLAGIEHAGARVGKFAISTAFRSLRTGRLELSQPAAQRELVRHLAAGFARAELSHRLLDAARPHVAMFMGNRYTGQGELMDVCIQRGVDVLTWFDAHRSSSLMLKRYNLENRDRHHGSISDATWRRLLAMPWTEVEQAALRRELHDSYAAGDWYSRGGTQVNKSLIPAGALRARLGLDPSKKTAVIFPHILWDATLFWGRDLFANYEDWLVNTVRAAVSNPRVNWIIKIHPAHVAKNAMERLVAEPAEMVAIRERLGPLPEHVTVIPPDTDINTFSLFGVMDVCLTVRGTIGIESACLGKRVVTAGTGRYDHHGFTIDPATADDYLSVLRAIDTLPPPTARERELAERFAYGAFVWRPFPLSTFTIEYGTDVEATMRVRLMARSSDELRQGADLQALGRWAANGRDEDFTRDEIAHG